MLETFPDHKYEYVHGDIRMMTGGTLAHAQIGQNIGALLWFALRGSDCRVYNSDAVVKLANDLCYCPDASISCDPADWTRKVMESPTVVVEVMSQYTQKTDQTEKLEAYKFFPTILEILLVDFRRRYVEHYHRVNMHQWENYVYVNDDDKVHLSSIDVVLAVSDIYLEAYLELEEEP
ncbi:hypothetical protein KDK_03480 [Dictyobacter kobayashii]|uniref:Putative restriction endonuclease domain-containing protein n=2 Tax=Dictyobacter kobayashii TaxID=2014872 RepID=A0A402ABU1_9CHLR|nr:hypothetical protein KDK_03480 [Dictyobacter kobayashii]